MLTRIWEFCFWLVLSYEETGNWLLKKSRKYCYNQKANSPTELRRNPALLPLLSWVNLSELSSDTKCLCKNLCKLSYQLYYIDLSFERVLRNNMKTFLFNFQLGRKPVTVMKSHVYILGRQALWEQWSYNNGRWHV